MTPRLQSGESREQQVSETTDNENTGLAEYIDQNREDLEKLADEDYPVSRLLQAFLDRRDRGEI